MVMFLIFVAGGIGVWLYMLRVRESAREQYEALRSELIAGGRALIELPDDDMHHLHMKIHEELKRRASMDADWANGENRT